MHNKMGDETPVDPTAVIADGRTRTLREDPFGIAVANERRFQRMAWGDDHDDDHTPAEWGLILLRYGGEVGDKIEELRATDFGETGTTGLLPLRSSAIKLAAVCCALVERIDREVAEIAADERGLANP